MRRLIAQHSPPLEQVPFKSLYRKEIYDARTRDGWVLQISRYRPVPQPWEQPYLGNSMGGMLGYGYAGSHRDLAGLITIGAPSDIGRGFLLIRAAALFGPAILGPLIDALCVAATGLSTARHGAAHALRRLGAGFLNRVADVLAPSGGRRRDLRFSHIPVDLFLRQLARISTPGNLRRYEIVAHHFGSLLNPARVTA